MRLGLTSNPFRTLSRKEWGQIAFFTPEIARLVHQEHAHLQLIGNMGRGKTTTLMGIQARCEAQGQVVIYEYLAMGQRRFKAEFIQKFPDVFLLDEAQRLWQYEKFRLLKICQKNPTMRLIFSSHADLSGWFQHRNLPLITYDVDTLPTQSLADLLNKRLQFFQTVNPAALAFSTDAILYLEELFGSDRRRMEQFLYEVFELYSELQPLTAEFLADCWREVSEAEARGVLSTVIHQQKLRTWRRY